jgi:hypothetical protein
MIFHNPYGHLNETSRQKIAKISKNIPATLRNLRKGQDVKKTDVSNLKYCLRAGFGLGNSEMFDNLVAIIPNKPSLIFYISEYLGYYFSNEDKEFYLANKKIIHTKYESIWKMYRNKSLTQWTRFSLLKILSAPPFARDHKEFQTEINRIVADPNAQFLRPVAFFYKAYVRDMVRWEKAMQNESIHAIDAGFTLDDIRRQIKNSETGTEQAIYYYFIFYLRDTEEEGVIRSLVFDALGSESPEVQTMGIFLIKKLYRKSLPEIVIEDMRSGRIPKTIGDKPITIETPEKDTLNISLEGRVLGELSRIYFKLPASDKPSPGQKKDELLTNDGKIAQGKLSEFFGMPTLKVEIVGKVQEDIATMATRGKQSGVGSKAKNNIIRLITKHEDDGDYFYMDRRINVNRNTLYYDVFDILFLNSNSDGYLSYKGIESHLVERKHPHIEDNGKRDKRIQNAISNEQQGFFKRAKIGSSVMKNKTPDERPLVEVDRGKGLKLNNPVLK